MSALDEVREHVEVADRVGTKPWATEHHLKLAAIKAAIVQAEATAELAEQQRIGNLIAYVAHRVEHSDATGGRDTAPALRSLLGSVDFAIRDLLGLNPDELA